MTENQWYLYQAGTSILTIDLVDSEAAYKYVLDDPEFLAFHIKHKKWLSANKAGKVKLQKHYDSKSEQIQKQIIALYK